jgi:hypothetical protein
MSESQFWHSTLKGILNKAKIYSRFNGSDEEDKAGYIDDVLS